MLLSFLVFDIRARPMTMQAAHGYQSAYKPKPKSKPMDLNQQMVIACKTFGLTDRLMGQLLTRLSEAYPDSYADLVMRCHGLILSLFNHDHAEAMHWFNIHNARLGRPPRHILMDSPEGIETLINYLESVKTHKEAKS